MLPDTKVGLYIPFEKLNTFKPIKISRFELSFRNSESRFHAKAFLFEKHLILELKTEEQPIHIKISYDFDLIFEFYEAQCVLEKGQDRENMIHSITFQKDGSFLILKTKDVEEILIWRSFLEKRLNQRGFHRLFNPIKELGNGSFGSVYLVRSVETKKKYAVKAFSKLDLYAQQSGKQLAIKEITHMRMFNHKNLMRMFGVYETENSLYIIVELLEGGQLNDMLRQKVRLKKQQIKKIMKAILRGLKTLHKGGIMHRDLKLQNILLRSKNDLDCVIADFGLTENVNQETYLFKRCGTPGFVAPQILKYKSKKEKYSQMCDLFSLGVIFHILLLKKLPFSGITSDEVINKNSQCSLNFDSKEYESLDILQLDLLQRLLEKNPKKRISANEAFEHSYLCDQKENIDHQKLQKINEMIKNSNKLKEQKKVEEANKELNRSRKSSNLSQQDSSYKLKTKEVDKVGKLVEEGQSVKEISSPLPMVMKIRPRKDSRFKKEAQSNS